MRTTTTVVAGIILAISLTGCTSLASQSSPSTDAETAESTTSPSFAAEPEVSEALPDTAAFGTAYTYTDGVSISVSAPSPFVPGEYAAGADQASNVVFSITITNGTEKNLEPYGYGTVSSGGVEGSAIYDSGNPIGDVGNTPTTTILPGGTVTWLEAYSIADPASIIFEIAPAFEYENAVFTNVVQ